MLGEHRWSRHNRTSTMMCGDEEHRSELWKSFQPPNLKLCGGVTVRDVEVGLMGSAKFEGNVRCAFGTEILVPQKIPKIYMLGIIKKII